MGSNEIYLEALVNGDSKLLLQMYNNNFVKVRNFILNNNGGLEDAQDVFQKALLQIAIRYKKEKFVIETNFEAYLFTVCKNLWRRELNKKKIKVTDSAFIEPYSEADEFAYMILEQKREELFKEKFLMLSENCRRILELFFSKMTYSQIIEVTEYNSETVARQRVFKCKSKLIDLIKSDVRYKTLKEL